MYEAIVTLVVPENIARLEPAHTEIYRIEFDSERAMRDWLRIGHPGIIADQKLS